MAFFHPFLSFSQPYHYSTNNWLRCFGIFKNLYYMKRFIVNFEHQEKGNLTTRN